MIKTINSQSMGKSKRGWLNSIFHFSFADYYNPQNMQFGALRVVNDDLINAKTGFDTHPHENMEIISYVIDGQLTHGDSMGNRQTLSRGQVQYMSAGTGITHSEHNMGKDIARFLQIWITPDADGYAPQYGENRFLWEDRVNKWLTIAAGTQNSAPITIHQDMIVSVLYLHAGKVQDYTLGLGRKAYLIQIEGEGEVNGNRLAAKDSAEITQEAKISIVADTDAHYILFDMAQ